MTEMWENVKKRSKYNYRSNREITYEGGVGYVQLHPILI